MQKTFRNLDPSLQSAGECLDKVMGAITRLNIIPICVCPTLQPSVSPPAAENSITRNATTKNSTGRPRWMFVPDPMSR